MKTSFDAFKKTVQKYVFQKVAPTLQNSADQFALGFAHGAIERRVEELLPKLEAFGVAKEGEVDVDAMERLVKHGFEATKDGKAEFQIPSMREAIAGLFGQKTCADCPRLTFSFSDWEEFRRMLC